MRSSVIFSAVYLLVRYLRLPGMTSRQPFTVVASLMASHIASPMSGRGIGSGLNWARIRHGQVPRASLGPVVVLIPLFGVDLV